ncbi:MAG: HEAT repeat domain-containing protein [Candidatus Heimdallarchaeota archaeon]
MSRQEEMKKLLERLEDPDQRKSVAKALAGPNPQLAVKMLSLAMELDTPVHRVRALEMIEIIGHNEKARSDTVGVLTRMARNDNDWSIRRMATEALGNLNDETAMPALIQGLMDEDPRVHEAAIASIKKLGAKALPYLQLELANDNPPLLKWRCIEVIKILEIPNLAVIQQLLPLVIDKEPIIRNEARAAIERFRNFFYEDLTRVTALLEDLDPKELEEEYIQEFLTILLKTRSETQKKAFKQTLRDLLESNN